jgi:hypothetical protein
MRRRRVEGGEAAEPHQRRRERPAKGKKGVTKGALPHPDPNSSVLTSARRSGVAKKKATLAKGPSEATAQR